MGKKSLLSLAGMVLAGAAMSGCQTSRPASGGPMMSGTPPMMGAANQTNANATGLAQNQTGQTQNWNNRNNMVGTSVSGTVPAAGTGYPAATTGAPTYNTSRMGAQDRSFQTPNTASGTTSYPRPGTSPSYSAGTTQGYPRTPATGASDRMLTSPTAPSYQPTSYGSTTQGSSIQSGLSKPTPPTSTPPAPAPVSATSPQFGSSSGLTGTSTAPSFTPPSEPNSLPVPSSVPGVDGNQ